MTEAFSFIDDDRQVKSIHNDRHQVNQVGLKKG